MRCPRGLSAELGVGVRTSVYSVTSELRWLWARHRDPLYTYGTGAMRPNSSCPPCPPRGAVEQIQSSRNFGIMPRGQARPAWVRIPPLSAVLLVVTVTAIRKAVDQLCYSHDRIPSSEQPLKGGLMALPGNCLRRTQ